jgi:hypothetical protein
MPGGFGQGLATGLIGGWVSQQEKQDAIKRDERKQELDRYLKIATSPGIPSDTQDWAWGQYQNISQGKKQGAKAGPLNPILQRLKQMVGMSHGGQAQGPMSETMQNGQPAPGTGGLPLPPGIRPQPYNLGAAQQGGYPYGIQPGNAPPQSPAQLAGQSPQQQPSLADDRARAGLDQFNNVYPTGVSSLPGAMQSKAGQPQGTAQQPAAPTQPQMSPLAQSIRQGLVDDVRNARGPFSKRDAINALRAFDLDQLQADERRQTQFDTEDRRHRDVLEEEDRRSTNAIKLEKAKAEDKTINGVAVSASEAENQDGTRAFPNAMPWERARPIYRGDKTIWEKAAPSAAQQSKLDKATSMARINNKVQNPTDEQIRAEWDHIEQTSEKRDEKLAAPTPPRKAAGPKKPLTPEQLDRKFTKTKTWHDNVYKQITTLKTRADGKQPLTTSEVSFLTNEFPELASQFGNLKAGKLITRPEADRLAVLMEPLIQQKYRQKIDEENRLLFGSSEAAAPGTQQPAAGGGNETIIVNPTTGARMKVVNGQWVEIPK